MSGQAEKVQTLGDYAAMFRRRWRLLVGIIPATILGSILLAYTLPPVYESSATILLEPSSISADLVQTTVVSYADQQIELVQRTVMSTDSLEKVVGEIDPYPDQKDVSARDKARMIAGDTRLEKVDPITLDPLPESNAFSLYYTNPDPEIAAQVTQKIADLFLAYNRETRVAQAKETYEFLSKHQAEVQASITDIERRIADFKRQYGDALPDSRDRNEVSLDRTQRDLDALDAQVRLVEQQESMLRLQLSQISPTMVASGTDAYTQLATLRAELAAARQRYTEDHPDVRRLSRSIEALAAQVQAGSGSSNVRPDNPEYLRVSAELEAVRRNLAALRSNAARARSQMAAYEARLMQTPGVERDYASLQREYEAAQAEYAQTQAKMREAAIAQSLEAEAKGERYTQIRSPRVADSPSSPNRLGLILLGIILGTGVAVGLAAFRESADPSVRGPQDLAAMTDVPVMGAIPMLLSSEDRHRRRLVIGSVAGVYGLAIIVVFIVVLAAR